MLYDLQATTRVSDMHGEPCSVCADRPCVTNVYLNDADGEADTRHTCENMVCVSHVLDTHHRGDDTPIVEVSTAPMPWESGNPAPVVALTDPDRLAAAIPADDIAAIADVVLSGNLA